MISTHLRQNVSALGVGSKSGVKIWALVRVGENAKIMDIHRITELEKGHLVQPCPSEP